MRLLEFHCIWVHVFVNIYSNKREHSANKNIWRDQNPYRYKKHNRVLRSQAPIQNSKMLRNFHHNATEKDSFQWRIKNVPITRPCRNDGTYWFPLRGFSLARRATAKRPRGANHRLSVAWLSGGFSRNPSPWFSPRTSNPPTFSRWWFSVTQIASGIGNGICSNTDLGIAQKPISIAPDTFLQPTDKSVRYSHMVVQPTASETFCV